MQNIKLKHKMFLFLSVKEEVTINFFLKKKQFDFHIPFHITKINSLLFCVFFLGDVVLFLCGKIMDVDSNNSLSQS